MLLKNGCGRPGTGSGARGTPARLRFAPVVGRNYCCTARSRRSEAPLGGPPRSATRMQRRSFFSGLLPGRCDAVEELPPEGERRLHGPPHAVLRLDGRRVPEHDVVADVGVLGVGLLVHVPECDG